MQNAMMPEWQCHKIVRAAPILRIDTVQYGGKTVCFHAFVDLGDGRTAHLECQPSMFARFQPGPGDYVVQYDDGYLSFSPRQAFLDGYARVEAPAAV